MGGGLLFDLIFLHCLLFHNKFLKMGPVLLMLALLSSAVTFILVIIRWTTHMKYTLPILISDLSKNRDYSRKASWKIMG